MIATEQLQLCIANSTPVSVIVSATNSTSSDWPNQQSSPAGTFNNVKLQLFQAENCQAVEAACSGGSAFTVTIKFPNRSPITFNAAMSMRQNPLGLSLRVAPQVYNDGYVNVIRFGSGPAKATPSGEIVENGATAQLPTLHLRVNPPMNVTMDLSRWMASLLYPNSTLSDIVIPGSHDAGMYTTFQCAFLPGTVVTQTLSFAGQLTAGIRYFDLRPYSWDAREFYAGLSTIFQ